MSQRLSRINRMLQTTLGELLPALVHDPRVQAADLIAIQDVKTSPDLGYADVFVSIEGSDDVCEDALTGLRKAGGFLRREVSRRIRLRRTPELRFVRDASRVRAARVSAILHELQRERAQPRPVELSDVAEMLAAAQRVLVTTHPDPDGDAIGSVVGLVLALRARGKDAVAYNPDPVPERLRFLRGAELFQRVLPKAPFALTIVLDCSDARMFPKKTPPRERLGQIVVIDHHKTVGELADFIYRDPTAASSGVLVFRLLKQMGVPLDLRMAEALYCSTLSDTGSFRYRNTNPECMRVAAELLEQGVDPWHIASNLYESQPPRQLELLAMVLPTLQLSPDGRTAALLVTDEMLQKTGCTVDMVDGFINYARALKDVEVGVLMRSQGTGLRVSLRSRGSVDVSEIASTFGGGGHRNAAGFTVSAAPEDVLPQIFEAVTQGSTRVALIAVDSAAG